MNFHLTAQVWQHGKLIATAGNLSAHGELVGGYRASGYLRGAHAEVRASRLARGKLARNRPWGLTVTRYRRDGSRGCSKPCKLCQAYLAGAGCSWVDYFDLAGDIQRMQLAT